MKINAAMFFIPDSFRRKSSFSSFSTVGTDGFSVRAVKEEVALTSKGSCCEGPGRLKKRFGTN